MGALRVALVTETFPPEIGGAALCAGRFVEALRAHGAAVHLTRPRQGADRRGGTAPGGDGIETLLVRGLPLPFHRGLQAGLPARRALLAAWRGFRPDVVHVMSEGLLGWSALQAARRLGLPVLTSFHTNFPSYGRHYGLGFMRGAALGYLRRFHRHGACALVPTAQVRDELAREGFSRTSVLGRGVDTALFAPGQRRDGLRQGWGAGPDDPVALVVGRLAPEKNVPLALRAFEAMKAVRPGARLVVVGDGPERRRLEAMAPGAVFTGMLRGAELAAHYASADVFLFPSLTETFGNVLLEAMASGLSVVAYADAAAAQLVQPGANGLSAPCGDEDAFVAHAVRLAERPELRRRLTVTARQTVIPLSWRRIGETYLERLREVAALRRPDRPGAGALSGSPAVAPASTPSRAAATPAGSARGS